MKKLLILLMIVLLLGGCTAQKSETPAEETQTVEKFDERDRPSKCGQLKVSGTQLCGQDGEAVMLRGISINDVMNSEIYLKAATFNDLSKMGINVFRLAMYIWGVGSVGYATGGEAKRLKNDIDLGVNYAKENDMYAIIDWHVLEDKDPNRYLEEAKEFFEEVSARYKDYDNVLYEICNEPNHVEWADVKAYAEVIIPIIRNNDPDSVIIVGTPNWSQDVDIAADDPLPYDNLLYTLHFYSASHSQELRDKAQYALDKGLPIFVSEFGITANTGNIPYDIEEADVWIDFLEERKISYVMWNFSKAAEGSAAIRQDCLKMSGFVYDDFTTAGQWLIDTIAKHQ